MSPDISFIACTSARPDAVFRCVKSIAAAAHHEQRLHSEIVIIENGPLDQMCLNEDELSKASNFPVRLIRLQARGLSRARNEGILNAKGNVFVFTDDDCILDLDYVQDLASHMSAISGDVVLGGRVKLGDPTDLHFTVKDVPISERFDTSVHPGGFLQGCNLVMSRKTASKIGYFDTQFGAGSPLKAGEDTDYLIRAHAAGLRLEYVPDMIVFHYHGRKNIADIEALNHCYAYANGAIYAKYLFREPWLAKHLYWTFRSALRERFGGPRFNEALKLSWSSVLKSHIMGIFGFLCRERRAPEADESLLELRHDRVPYGLR